MAERISSDSELTSTASSDPYDLELYKSPCHEAASYLEKIPAVWVAQG
jgi:hypothetical protein